MIRSLGGNRYSLEVPRTALFNVWVEPIVEVEVNLQLPPARRSVVIKVPSTALESHDLVARFGRWYSDSMVVSMASTSFTLLLMSDI